MFTGIVSTIGTIAAAQKKGDLAITIACDFTDLTIGESVAVNGVCLTVVASKDPTCHLPLVTYHSFTASLSAETLNRTAPRWEKGEKVNLERALKIGDRLDGHMVTGHVDGAAKIIEIKQEGDSRLLCLEAPAELIRFIAEKGSVTLDGVSLTVNKLENPRFWVNIIPHTWAATTFCDRKPGDMLNLEIDLIARYVERLMKPEA